MTAGPPLRPSSGLGRVDRVKALTTPGWTGRYNGPPGGPMIQALGSPTGIERAWRVCHVSDDYVVVICYIMLHDVTWRCVVLLHCKKLLLCCSMLYCIALCCAVLCCVECHCASSVFGAITAAEAAVAQWSWTCCQGEGPHGAGPGRSLERAPTWPNGPGIWQSVWNRGLGEFVAFQMIMLFCCVLFYHTV